MQRSTEREDEFFVGWQDKLPKGQSGFLRQVLLIMASLAVVIAGGLVLSQRGFADSTFEFGTLKTFEGILLTDPVPMLQVRSVNSDPRSPAFEQILLVGFGKMTALKSIHKIREAHGSFENKPIKIKGTLIYHEGKKALELTEQEQSFDGWGDEGISYPAVDVNPLGDQRLIGEILDPKCALGVMKPGVGKPHRSCAIRCISGGIPPLLKVRRQQATDEYYIILGRDGKPVNKEILPYVADQIRVCGTVSQLDDWKVVQLDPSSDLLRLNTFPSDTDIPMCQN